MVNAESGLVEPQVHKSFCILHFNDCYNVEPQELHEPIGGAARFVTALRTFNHLQPVTLFSGDIIAPSIMSTFTKGEQMLPVLEACNVSCSIYGNHEFGRFSVVFHLIEEYFCKSFHFYRFWS